MEITQRDYTTRLFLTLHPSATVAEQLPIMIMINQLFLGHRERYMQEVKVNIPSQCPVQVLAHLVCSYIAPSELGSGVLNLHIAIL